MRSVSVANYEASTTKKPGREWKRVRGEALKAKTPHTFKGRQLAEPARKGPSTQEKKRRSKRTLAGKGNSKHR